MLEAFDLAFFDGLLCAPLLLLPGFRPKPELVHVDPLKECLRHTALLAGIVD